MTRNGHRTAAEDRRTGIRQKRQLPVHGAPDDAPDRVAKLAVLILSQAWPTWSDSCCWNDGDGVSARGDGVTRAAAIFAWITGAGFGLLAVFGLRYFARRHEVWTFMGFPTYGGGPFERWGIPTSVPLLAGFIAVCVAEVVVGVLLWSGRPIGLWLAIGLLPLESIYWIGFALPFGPILGAIRTIPVVLAITGR